VTAFEFIGQLMFTPSFIRISPLRFQQGGRLYIWCGRFVCLSLSVSAGFRFSAFL